MDILNGWSHFNIDSYFDNLRQQNGEYRVGIRVLCDDENSTVEIMDFVREFVGYNWWSYIKCIRGVYSPLPPYDETYDSEATVDAIFKPEDEELAYKFVHILCEMNAYPDKTFAEVEAILDGLLDPNLSSE